jgi:hypothetical protein
MQGERKMSKPQLGKRALTVLVLTSAMLASRGSAWAQTFNSGSTGADGALNIPTSYSGKTVNFKATSPTDDPNTPSIETALGRSLNWDDTRFDFTTITIPSGVTLRMSARWTNGPIYFLATQEVSIAGKIDLGGEGGPANTRSIALRTPATPGPGGFPGGVGGNGVTDRAPQAGAGPEAGRLHPTARRAG